MELEVCFIRLESKTKQQVGESGIYLRVLNMGRGRAEPLWGQEGLL